MLAVSAKMTIREGEVPRVRAALEALLAPTRAEPGCIMFQPHLDTDNPRVILVYEQWADEAALLFHRETPHYKHYVPEEIFPFVEEYERLILEPFGMP